MSQLRVKIALNKGRQGIPLHKLADIAGETQKFLELFSDDLKLGEGEWIAENFKNGSVTFESVFIGESEEMAILLGQKALRHITDNKTTADSLDYGIKKETFLQYARIALPVAEDDFVSIGIYNGKARPLMRKLSKQRALEIEKQIRHTVRQYGGVQGRITALFKASNTLWVQDLLTGHRLSCNFPSSMYDQVIHLLKARDAILNIEGWLRIINGAVEHLDIEKMREAAGYREGDLDKFFGCDPEFTSSLSTEEYLDKLRNETNESQFVS